MEGLLKYPFISSMEEARLTKYNKIAASTPLLGTSPQQAPPSGMCPAAASEPNGSQQARSPYATLRPTYATLPAAARALYNGGVQLETDVPSSCTANDDPDKVPSAAGVGNKVTRNGGLPNGGSDTIPQWQVGCICTNLKVKVKVKMVIYHSIYHLSLVYSNYKIDLRRLNRLIVSVQVY